MDVNLYPSTTENVSSEHTTALDQYAATGAEDSSNYVCFLSSNINNLGMIDSLTRNINEEVFFKLMNSDLSN